MHATKCSRASSTILRAAWSLSRKASEISATARFPTSTSNQYVRWRIGKDPIEANRPRGYSRPSFSEVSGGWDSPEFFSSCCKPSPPSARSLKECRLERVVSQASVSASDRALKNPTFSRASLNVELMTQNTSVSLGSKSLRYPRKGAVKLSTIPSMGSRP